MPRRTATSARRRPRFVPRLDGEPHRPWASLNVRAEEKRRFDLLQKWWSMQEDASLAHWDGFSILMAHYLSTAPLPADLLSLLGESDLHPM